MHLGEFAPTGVLETPLLMLGNVDPLCVRVDFDENEAWRVRSDAHAVGYLRGNKAINTPLKFVRLEPYVSPKKSLTGDSTERVDTRVLQVIYALERPRGLPVRVGQQMDVFVEAPARRHFIWSPGIRAASMNWREAIATASSIRRSRLPIGASQRNQSWNRSDPVGRVSPTSGPPNAAASYALTTLPSKCILACSILLKAEQLIQPVDAPGNNSSTICKIQKPAADCLGKIA